MSWTKEERAILSVTSANHFLVHVIEFGFPALVIPLAQYFRIPLAAAIALSQGMYLLYGLGALPAGLISDKWSLRSMLFIGAAGGGVALIAAAFAPSPITLMVALTFVGLFMSIYHPAGMSIISDAVSERGRAMGINGMFGNIGIASGPFIAGISNYIWGWRAAFIAIGAVSFIVAVFMLRVQSIPHKNKVEAAGDRGEEKQLAFYFLFVCLIVLCAGFLYRMTTISMPAYMEESGPSIAAGLADAKKAPFRNLTANLFMFVVYIGGILGQLAGGKLSDRFDLRKVYLCFYLMVIPLVLAAAYARGYWLALTVMVLVFFQLGIQPVENSLIAKLTPVRWRSTAYGLKFVLGFGVGSLSVATVGIIQKNHGFPMVFKIGFLNALIIAALVGLLWFISRNIGIRNKKT